MHGHLRLNHVENTGGINFCCLCWPSLVILFLNMLTNVAMMFCNCLES